MNLVDDVYTIFSFRRWVLDLFPDLTDIFDAVVGCGIDLHYIQGCSGQDLFTARTFPAGTSVHRMFAARARIFATVVLPVPRVPQNRYAWPILPELI